LRTSKLILLEYPAGRPKSWLQNSYFQGQAPGAGTHARAVEARLKLAEVVMSLAKNGTQDSARLTEESLKIMFASPSKL
jgi:hypothetical protein